MKQEIQNRINQINNGIVPEGYKKTKVGICPNDWETHTIAEYFEFKNGLNKEKEAFGKGTPIINYTDVWKKRGLFSEDVKGRVTLSTKEISNYNVKEGDVFFTRTSETIDEIGFSSVLLEDIPNCVFSGFVLRGRPIKDGIVKEYNKYCYSTENVRNEIIKKSSMTTRALTNGTLLGEVNLNLPSKSEQNKIAEVLMACDKVVDLQKQYIDKLLLRKSALMQKLLTPQPDWIRTNIKELEDNEYISLHRGNVISKITMNENPGNYPVYSSSVVDNGLMGKYGCYMFDEELITWSIDGGGNFFYRPKHKFSVTNVCGYIRVDENKINCKFLAYLLQNEHSKKQFDYISKAHPSVIRTMYKFSMPCLEVQQKIVDVLSALDKQIELEKQKLQLLINRQKSLQQLLLTGIVRVI